MKRWISLILAFVIFSISIFSVNYRDGEKLRSMEGLKYNSIEKYYDSPSLVKATFSEGDKLIMGSSEFMTLKESAFHPNLLLQDEGSNPVLVGRGNTQSLYHTLFLGSTEGAIKNKKAVLIVSPQWFSYRTTNSRVFMSTFNEDLFKAFMRNDRLSEGLKEDVKEKVYYAMSPDIGWREKLFESEGEREESPYFIRVISDQIRTNYLDFYKLREASSSWDSFDIRTIDPALYETKELFDQGNIGDLEYQAEELSREDSSNNNFFMTDTYYDSYVKPSLKKIKGKYSRADFCQSDEFYDLDLFLRTCQETGIEPLIIIIPFNGRYYDYLGYDQKKREDLYEKIRETCKNRGAKISDFSDKEYEPYFLNDAMHLGRKGWVDVSKAIEEFYR